MTLEAYAMARCKEQKKAEETSTDNAQQKETNSSEVETNLKRTQSDETAETVEQAQVKRAKYENENDMKMNKIETVGNESKTVNNEREKLDIEVREAKTVNCEKEVAREVMTETANLKKKYVNCGIERVVFIDSTWHQVHKIASDERLKGMKKIFVDLWFKHTVLARFLAHAPISEHVPLLECRRSEVNCNIYNIGTPAFSIISQNTVFQKARLYGILLFSAKEIGVAKVQRKPSLLWMFSYFYMKKDLFKSDLDRKTTYLKLNLKVDRTHDLWITNSRVHLF